MNRLGVAVSIVFLLILTACGKEKNPGAQFGGNYIEGQIDHGVKELSLTVPRMGLTEALFERLHCRIHIKGVFDRKDYPIDTYLTAMDPDSLKITADDPIIKELPHQKYYLNYITFPDLTKAEEQADTLYLGAALSVENPNEIRFLSSLNAEANSVGTGTVDDPYTIACGQDFIRLIADNMVLGTDYKGVHFALTDDISLLTHYYTNNQGWEPAGHNAATADSFTKFNGTLDGNGFCISGITHNQPESNYAGLFYHLGSEAYIREIELRPAINGKEYLGALACFADEGCRLEDIVVSGYINGKGNMGGLIAEIGSGSVSFTRCLSAISMTNASGTVTHEGGTMIGGFVGNSYPAALTFTDCVFQGLINTPTVKSVGGFVGQIYQASFNHCLVSGVITGNSFTGGFIGNDEGRHSEVSFSDCSAGATIAENNYDSSTQQFLAMLGVDTNIVDAACTVSGVNYVGGFMGEAEYSYFSGENKFSYENNTGAFAVQGERSVGGIAGGGNLYLEPESLLTSIASVKGTKDCVGGIIGEGYIYDSGQAECNATLIEGLDRVGGIIGDGAFFDDVTLINKARVKGKQDVGGLVGYFHNWYSHDPFSRECKALAINEGDVEGSGERVGGMFGKYEDKCSISLDLREGSRVGQSEGSLTIRGGSSATGGVMGMLYDNVDIKSLPRCYANIMGKSDVGGIIGIIDSPHYYSKNKECKIFRAPVEGHSIITSSEGNNVGGVIGRINSDREFILENCTFSGSISAQGNNVGGIVGYIDVMEEDDFEYYDGAEYQLIRNCHNKGAVTVEKSGTGIGGIIGKCRIPCTISQCSNEAVISAKSATQIGGIIGRFSGPKSVLEQCYNKGEIKGQHYESSGGIVGLAYSNQTVKNCYNNVNCSGSGIVGHHDANDNRKLKIQYCYSMGDTTYAILETAKDEDDLSISDCYYYQHLVDGGFKGVHPVPKLEDMYKQSTFKNFSTDIWKFHEGVKAPTLIWQNEE